MIKVSVVIPTYNCEKFLQKAINSVLSQTYSNIEIIVVDDGSTDNTKEMVNNIESNILRYYYQDNSGPGSARNHGIEKALGSYISFLDADDYFHPENIEYKINIFENNPNIEWLFSDVVFVDTVGNEICLGSEYFKNDYTSNKFKEKKIFKALLESGNFINTSGIIVRRNCFKNIGMFDENQLLHQDYLQWLRLSYAYPNFIYIKKPLSYMTRRTTSWGNIGVKSFIERLKLYEKIENEFSREVSEIRNSWNKRVADVYNRLGVSEMQSNKQLARKYYMKSILKKPLQKFAYLNILRTF
ncbi:MAG: glycosyltransferase [Pseudomonadota bacterium]